MINFDVFVTLTYSRGSITNTVEQKSQNNPGAAVVQWKHVHSGGLLTPKRTGSNPGHSAKGDWASTRGNRSQMSELSNMKSPFDRLFLYKFSWQTDFALVKSR